MGHFKISSLENIQLQAFRTAPCINFTCILWLKLFSFFVMIGWTFHSLALVHLSLYVKVKSNLTV